MSGQLIAGVDADVAVWVDGVEHQVSVKAGRPVPVDSPADRAVARVLLDAGHTADQPEPEPEPEPAPTRRRKET